MADDDRPSLEAPKFFGRRRATPAPSPAADEPVFEDSAVAATQEQAPVERTVVDQAPVEAPAETTVQPAVEPADAPAATPRRTRRVRAARPPRAPRAARPERADRAPLLVGVPAAVLTGVLAGLALVGFTWLGFRGCEAARGTSSCGTAPGMAALILVFVLAVVVGTYLLKYFRVPDPSATSFLATGLTGVICLLFLVDVLDHWSMVVVIPAISAGTFTLSWWVTTTYVEPD